MDDAVAVGEERVAFSGLRSGTTALTWAQRSWWPAYRTGTEFLSVDLPLPGQTTMDDIRAAVRRLLDRHESLRTCYPVTGGGERVQRLLGAGAYDLRIERLDGTVGDGPADRAAGLTAELTGTPVDHERDVPVRVGVLVGGTRPVHLVLVVSAFAVDCWSIATLRQDLAALLPGGEPPEAPPPRQPAGMAGWEQSAAGARTEEEALEFWRDRLAEMPRTLFPVSPESPDPAADPHWLCRFDSTPTAVGCTLLSTRYRVSTGHVLLAGLAAVLGAHTGVAACPLGLIVNNRMADPAAVGSAMLYMQEGICAVPLGDASFRELALACRSAAMAAHRYARYDPAARDAALAREALRRGMVPMRSCLVNDTRRPATFLADGATPELLRAPDLAGEAACRWRPYGMNLPGVDLFVTVLNRADTASLAVLTDTRQVSRTDVAALLRGLELVITQAAVDDLRLTDVGALTGLGPPAALSTWTFVERSWVNPSSVEQCLRATAGTADVLVLPADDGGRRSLVGYVGLPVGAPVPDLADLHARLTRAVDGVRDAVAPGHYVVCAGAPQDGGSPGAWRRLPVLAEGTGREPVLAGRPG
ncbi:condensation domain-containing protein [Plantactinospora sp. KLBMP9567]|nr:condensation domain-containing protein [Plantactinospora sp. KLBMP9567]